MVEVLGFDIGGANTKAARLKVENGKLQQVSVCVQYFPIWKEPDRLPKILLELNERLGCGRLDALGVTMTAELSDAYQTKREGVSGILSCVKAAFPKTPIHVLNTDANLQTIETSTAQPLSIAAANWAATGWLVSEYIKNAVVVDIGSTSTSIIPILNGKIAATGKTDLDKLIVGELVYTGSLRTNVATIVQSIPTKSGVASVSSELFATSGDVHRILGHITEADYTSETADGRGKTSKEAMARMSRVICADIEMLSKQEIVDIANYVYEKQIDQIAAGLSRVYNSIRSQTSQRIPIVVTGLGKDFLACKSAEKINADEIIDISSLLRVEAVLATPAFGVALRTAYEIEKGH